VFEFARCYPALRLEAFLGSPHLPLGLALVAGRPSGPRSVAVELAAARLSVHARTVYLAHYPIEWSESCGIATRAATGFDWSPAVVDSRSIRAADTRAAGNLLSVSKIVAAALIEEVAAHAQLAESADWQRIAMAEPDDLHFGLRERRPNRRRPLRMRIVGIGVRDDGRRFGLPEANS
jgi:hypothetical protein